MNGHYVNSAAAAGAGGGVADRKSKSKNDISGEPHAKAAKILLITQGCVMLAALITGVITSVVNDTSVINTALSSAYTAYQPFNASDSLEVNCTAQTNEFRPVPIAWTALFVTGLVYLMLGIFWYRLGSSRSMVGHVRARWFYSAVGISMSVWFCQILVGTVQIMEWVLSIGLVWALCSIEWTLAETRWNNFKFVKENSTGTLYKGYSLKGIALVEIFIALFILAQLGVSLGYAGTDAMIGNIAVWIKVAFGFQIVTLIAYVVFNCLYHLASIKAFDPISASEIATSIIVMVMVMGVCFTGLIGMYVELNP